MATIAITASSLVSVTPNSAADTAIELLARAFRKRVANADPMRYTKVHSGLLSCPQVVRILSNDDATTNGVVVDPFKGLPAAAKTELSSTGGDVSPSIARYFVTVHNIDTDEEYMHPVPLLTLTHWHTHFLDKPIFRNVDFVREGDFNALQAPTAANTWTTLKLVKGDQLFHVITTLAPLDPSLAPNACRDSVLLYLLTPSLPSNQTTLQTAARTSDQRRAVALNFALHSLADAFGFKPIPSPLNSETATTLTPPAAGKDVAAAAMQQLHAAMAQASFLHGDRIHAADAFKRTVLGGAFLSSVAETNAGGVVIPLALKFARFLLPALRADSPVTYDIVQPHRFGYVFQVRSLGGWRVLGAVNMHASPQAILSQFQLRELSPDDDDNRAMMMMALPTSPVSIADFSGFVDTTLRDTQTSFNAQFTDWVKKLSNKRGDVGAGYNIYGPFTSPQNERRADIDQPTTDAQRMHLPSPMWSLLTTHVGLRLLQAGLAANNDLASNSLDVRRSDAFVDHWLACMLLPDAAAAARTPPPFVDVAMVLFQMAFGLAFELIMDLLDRWASDTTTTKSELTAQDITNLLDGTPDSPIALPIPACIALVRSCRGTPPSTWCTKQRSNVFKDPRPIVQMLHVQPKAYAALLPPSVFSSATYPSDLRERLANVRFHEPQIMRAYNRAFAYATGRGGPPIAVKAPTDPTKSAERQGQIGRLAVALAYVLFSGDEGGLLSKWA